MAIEILYIGRTLPRTQKPNGMSLAYAHKIFMQNPTITIYNGRSTATVEIMSLSSCDYHQCGRRLPALVTDTYARVTHYSCLRKLQASRKDADKGQRKKTGQALALCQRLFALLETFLNINAYQLAQVSVLLNTTTHYIKTCWSTRRRFADPQTMLVSLQYYSHNIDCHSAWDLHYFFLLLFPTPALPG